MAIFDAPILNILDLHISNSIGYGLLFVVAAQRLDWRVIPIKAQINITSSSFQYNNWNVTTSKIECIVGGNIAFIFKPKDPILDSVTRNERVKVSLKNVRVTGGTGSTCLKPASNVLKYYRDTGGGLSIIFLLRLIGQIEIHECVFNKNTGNNGGGLHIRLMPFNLNFEGSSLKLNIEKTQFTDNEAIKGGGLFLVYLIDTSPPHPGTSSFLYLSFNKNVLERNSATIGGRCVHPVMVCVCACRQSKYI